MLPATLGNVNTNVRISLAILDRQTLQNDFYVSLVGINCSVLESEVDPYFSGSALD
ncbi:MAG: hypothetical protein UY67_C0018G0001 [Candidatus Kaiserbacteria bacterium GW2011_GWA2_52_12]|uniref:Uncharacterized protein n=1 Tax=Candidatus Kaiserbacteria bacterium GW2011_GWA2_52_12 TaxID=1618671 RepID=A0A0G1ZVP1_9BACT|nr:MAG: hypothetical protein UY67_C0018G0001 [Candidatus Kaiserbacteria bacterium GW2011_GWA2_52_12]